jgi:hypothetical protein
MAAFDEAAPRDEIYIATEPNEIQLVREMRDLTAVDQQRILRFAMALVRGNWPQPLDATVKMSMDDFRALCDTMPGPMMKSHFPCVISSEAIAGKTVHFLRGRGADMRYDIVDSDRFLAEMMDSTDSNEYMGPCIKPGEEGYPVWDNTLGPICLSDDSLLYVDWHAAQEILPGMGDEFYDEPADVDSRILPTLQAQQVLQETPERLFHVVDADETGLKADTFGASEFIAAMAARGFKCLGPVRRARLRYELQGLPAFDGLYGPMYSRTGIRYETQRAHARMSS